MKLPVLDTPDYATGSKILAGFILELAEKRQPLRILEAGCGRQWPLRLPGVKYSLTGVDRDPHGLEARKTAIGDLDEAIVGDLREVDFPDESFDVIYCSYVLEHIEGAEKVLDRFVRWLRKDGILMVMIPDRDTVWSFVSRLTPYWFHIAFKRYVGGNVNAGKPGFGPFPTHDDPILSRRGIHAYCRRRGLRVRHEHARVFRAKVLRPLVDLGTRVIAWLSFGRLDWRHNDLVLVLDRQGSAG